jgi:glycosyltransferase involved in cell wall biosynthesis
MTAHSPGISVVVIARDEGAYLRQTVEQFGATLPPGSEILVVDDGSTDGSTDFLDASDSRARLIRVSGFGVARARNYGARHAAQDVLVFADAHVTTPAGWWRPMVDLLADPRVGAVGPVIHDTSRVHRRGFGQRLQGPDLSLEWLVAHDDRPYQVPILPGGFWALRRETFVRTCGFDEGMTCWGSEDCELSLRLWLLGFELLLVPEVAIGHLFRASHPYHVEWKWVLGNRLRIAFVHFAEDRIARVTAALEGHEDFVPALRLTLASDFARRRSDYASRRVRDDGWYFDRFGPGF